MPQPLQEQKKALRTEIKCRKGEYSMEELSRLSALIVGRLLVHPRYQTAKTILLYHPLADEVNILALANPPAPRTGNCVGKTILLPKVTGRTTMELRQYTSPEHVEQGAFGIMEPRGPLFTAMDMVDLAIIPGIAFDRNGNRLGRGKGYYDRLLPSLSNAYKIGVCFSFQLYPEIPVTETDTRMDEVVTDAG